MAEIVGLNFGDVYTSEGRWAWGRGSAPSLAEVRPYLDRRGVSMVAGTISFVERARRGEGHVVEVVEHDCRHEA